MRKYYLAVLSITIGEYEIDTAIRFSTENNPELLLDSIAQDFYGECYYEEDGIYYFNGGEVAVKPNGLEEVSKSVWDIIPNQIACVMWEKERV
jgi:hypothetical protein